jgi:hypothetical protein
MNYAFLIVSLIIGFNCSAQEPTAALELPEMNLLYRGYPNKVTPAVTNNNGRHVSLIGSNVTIKKSGETGFIVKPGKGRYTTLSVVLSDNEKFDTIRTIRFRVQNLPDPELYWAGSRNGQRANIREVGLFAKYPPEIPLNASFSVTAWKIIHKGDTISGKGSNLSPAHDLFKTIKEETNLLFEVECIGPDGIVRIKKGTWIVFPWEDEKNEIKVRAFKCG